ncbi:caspase, EACC1-associated type [Streptacidiphilus melanogenes]|uniref:caspase, EACC1-associated type n=1 Tax=Streptacidiphilus melanogenes TaxID=411235 RepID=UPI0005A8262A|nr:AAA domain-containing protein [Streptacidiphilus melanogenes]
MTRLIRRRALLIGNERHDDGRFGPLPSAHADVWGLGQVLRHRNIGNFVSADSMTDLTADEMRDAISEFLEACEPDELALLYISGHGVRRTASGGEFYFVATDTDYDRIEETGVSAGFVNERLEACWAPQKIVMLDSCRSGGFAVGLRTSNRLAQDAAAKSEERAPITSRGVYVLSSSRAGEDSFAGTVSAEAVKPSVFTAEVIEALRTGKVGKDGTGEISVDELFEYVNRRMRRLDNGRQVPVKSAQGVDDTIILAACPLGSAPILVPLSGKPTAPSEHPTKSAGPKRVSSQPSWTDIIGYYRECILSDEADAPLMPVDEAGTSYVCLSGAERLLSGDVDGDNCISLPDEAVPLLDAAAEQNAELWAGYPAILLHGQRGRRSWRSPKFAPLLIRRVELVQDNGATRLKPYGPVLPHPRLARDWLGEEEAAQLAETYQPTWHRGQHDRMAVDIRNLLAQEFELPCVQELRPDQLAESIDIDTPGQGARNAAVLFLAPSDTKATKKLLDDLGAIESRAAHIKSTALAALSPDPAERTSALALTEAEPQHLVAPLSCNDGQEAVLRSAMTRRLTVATGPPGTGKSQLVANLVATAVANDQSVLVASTNNEAVDEVWRRCERLVPGSVVRTGSAWAKTMDYTEAEGTALQALRAAPAPLSNVPTLKIDAATAGDALTRVGKELSRIAEAERLLLAAGESRETYAAQLHTSVSELLDFLAPGQDLEKVRRKTDRLARARVAGEWRRRRYLRRVGVDPGDQSSVACRALAGFVSAHARWLAELAPATRTDDQTLIAGLHQAEQRTQAASQALLEAVVRTNARNGRQRIAALLTARDSGRSDWAAVRDVLPAVKGWAVTNLSARRFPPDAALFDLVIIDEASQCAIPHVLPLLFRARRALIIGDTMQLAHIAKVGPEREALIRRTAGLRSSWLEKHRLAYRRHSAFHAAERASGGSLLLDEHFRCHPRIAAVSNELFYDGGLTVLTDIRNRPCLPRPAIFWAHVPGRATRPRNGGSWVNDDEARQVDRFVASLLAELPPEATVGVVTPFKAQATELERQLAGYGTDRLRVGTVHTFQGGERDVMVFSLVAGTGMSPSAISWVDNQLNLWNVAITRARSHLIVVGDAELWRKRGGVATTLLDAAGTEPPATTDTPVELLKRLYQELSTRPSVNVALAETVNGHIADAVMRHDDGSTTAVLLDPGPQESDNGAHHLRVSLHRLRLLEGGEADARAVRCPAWRLFDVAERPRPTSEHITGG